MEYSEVKRTSIWSIVYSNVLLHPVRILVSFCFNTLRYFPGCLDSYGWFALCMSISTFICKQMFRGNATEIETIFFDNLQLLLWGRVISSQRKELVTVEICKLRRRVSWIFEILGNGMNIVIKREREYIGFASRDGKSLTILMQYTMLIFAVEFAELFVPDYYSYSTCGWGKQDFFIAYSNEPENGWLHPKSNWLWKV